MKIIGELINNSFARARNAWMDRNLAGYQKLARIQSDKGAAYLNVNVDGTQNISVKMEEMLEFLPELIPALQEEVSIPLSFDNPSIEYQKIALKHYDRARANGAAPIMNSLAASRENFDEMVELVKEYDTKVIVMASEKFLENGSSAQCLNPRDSYESVKYFVELLTTKAGRKIDDIIVDPGLAPVGADTYGLVNTGLDTMRLATSEPDLAGLHFSVGLSNFAWGTPKGVKHELERAYLTLASEVGLDYVLGNPERSQEPLPADAEIVGQLRNALEEGRVQGDETQEDAGFRQAEAIMDICSEYV